MPNIPDNYGTFEPTAIYVPFEELINKNNREVVTREIFGPF